jgi:hypothetical protein
VLRRIRNNDRHPLPARKVKEFLQIVGDELKRTGDLQRGFVARALQQVKSEQWLR